MTYIVIHFKLMSIMKNVIFIAALLFSVNSIKAQIITTIAGTGTLGYSGDGGLAINALLSRPNQIIYDQAGNLFIAEDYNHIVRKIDASGNISTVAGTGTEGFSGDGGLAVNAEFSRVAGVTIDAVGNIYICDADNFRIRKVDLLGNINTIVGTGNEGYTGDGGLAINAEIGFISGILVDPAGNIYIANQTYHNIRKIDVAGIITTVAGDGSGNPGYGGEGVLAASTMVNSPAALFMDGAGNLFFSELGGFRIRKINTSGIVTTVAGTGMMGSSGDGGAATSAQILYPYGIVVDASGVIYFCESGNNKIRKIDASGMISTYAGIGGFVGGYSGDNGPALLAQFYNPSAITLDNNNNVIVGDYGNNVIRKITSAVTSIETFNADSELSIYPNPFSCETVISFNKAQNNSTITIVNSLGEIIKSVQFNGTDYILERKDMTDGIYFVQIIDDNKVVSTAKLIVQ